MRLWDDGHAVTYDIDLEEDFLRWWWSSAVINKRPKSATGRKPEQFEH
jgi:hypothetical protein